MQLRLDGSPSFNTPLWPNSMIRNSFNASLMLFPVRNGSDEGLKRKGPGVASSMIDHSRAGAKT